MVIAWVGFASIGIFMARFTRVAFGDKELLGTKVWFTVRYDEGHCIFLVFCKTNTKFLLTIPIHNQQKLRKLMK